MNLLFLAWACIPALLLSACLFDGDGKPGPGPRTRFDFSRLDSLESPFSKWYAIGKGRNLVGVKFAFTSVSYQHQVDSNIAAFSAELGKAPALAGAYFDLASRSKNLKTFLEAVAANGCIPFVTLDPKVWDERDMKSQRPFIALINSGQFDDTLNALAGTLRDFGKPVMLRFAHERNGDWYPYSGAFSGGGADADGNGLADGPQNYVRAWRRVHDLFAGQGAVNLVWVFCPNAESFPKADWNRPFRYYPGSAYVDLIAVDSYESPDKAEQSLEEVVGEYVNEMGLHFESMEGRPGEGLKPFGMSEFGTYRRDSGSKADWYESALRYISGNPRVQFCIFYNARNSGKDFSITGIGARLRAAMADPRFTFGALEQAVAAWTGTGP
ncbi:MAG TPA: glycosyl hydrolase [Fibrobacteria bacterium]|nr:glycosyl hydrolase [Fibrobacteria bacterium]